MSDAQTPQPNLNTPIAPNHDAAPSTTWICRALTPAGALGEDLGAGALAGSFAAGLSYSASGRSYILVHKESGDYSVLGVGADGTIGQVMTSGTLSSFYPAMTSYSVDGRCYWLGQASNGTWASRELFEDGSVSEVLGGGELPFTCSTLTCCTLGDAPYAVGPRAGGRGLLLFALREGGAIGPVQERAWASDKHVFAFTQGGRSYLVALMDGRFYSFEVSVEDKEIALCAYDSLGLGSGDADVTFAGVSVHSQGANTFIFAQEAGGAFVVIELFEGGLTWAEVCRGTSPRPYEQVLVVPREGGVALVGLSDQQPPVSLAIGVSSVAARTPHAAAKVGVRAPTAVRTATRANYELRELLAEGPQDEVRASGVFEDVLTHIFTFAAGSQYHNGVFVCREGGSYTIHELTGGQIGRTLASGALGAHYPVLFAFVDGEETFLLGHKSDATWIVRPLGLAGVGDVVAAGTLDAHHPVLLSYKRDAHAIGQREGGEWCVWDLTRGGLSAPRASGTLGSFHETMIPFGFVSTDKDVGFCLVHGESGWLDAYALTENGLGEKVATCDLGGRSEVMLPFSLGREDATLLYARARSGAWSIRELVPPRDRRAGRWFERGGVALPWLSEPSASGFRRTDARTAVVLPAWPRPTLLEVAVVRKQLLTQWILQGFGESGAPQSAAATGELPGTFSTVLPFVAGERPKLFAHHENGEWSVFELPGGRTPSTTVATGNLQAFHPSLLVYSVGGAQYLLGQRMDGGYSTWKILADGSLGGEMSSGSLPYFCPQLFPCMIGGKLHGMGIRHTDGGLLLFSLNADGSVGPAQKQESDHGARLYPFTSRGEQYVLSNNGLELAILRPDSKTGALVRIGGASHDDTHDTFVAISRGNATYLLGQRLNGDWTAYSLSDDGASLTRVSQGTCDRYYPSIHALPAGHAYALFAMSPQGAPAPLLASPPGGLWLSARLDLAGVARNTNVAALPSHVAQLCVFGRDYALLHFQDGLYRVHMLLNAALGRKAAEGDLGAYHPVLIMFGEEHRLFGHREDGTWFIRDVSGVTVGPIVRSGVFAQFYRSVLDVSYGRKERLLGVDDEGKWTLWSVSMSEHELVVEQTGTLDGAYANFLSFRKSSSSGTLVYVLGQRNSGACTTWRLSQEGELERIQRDVIVGFDEFCPVIRLIQGPESLSEPSVFAERSDGSYVIRPLLPDPMRPAREPSGTLGSYYPTVGVLDDQYEVRVFACAPDPSPPGVQWFSQRMMPDGTASEGIVTGGLGSTTPALLPFSTGAPSSSLLLHEESGRYRMHRLNGAGGIGEAWATGRLPHYYPTMCAFTMNNRVYWLGQREDGVYSVRPILKDGTLGPEVSKGTLPFACVTLFVYSAGAKLFCFGYDGQRTLLCPVWSTGSLGPAKLGVGVKGSLPFKQDGKQYFITPAFTTYTPSADGSRWEVVAFEALGISDISSFVPVSAGGRQYVLWQALSGYCGAIELFEGGRRWAHRTFGPCQRVYDRLFTLSVSGLPFILGVSTQGACTPLGLRPYVDERDYPLPARSTIPVLTPPPPPEFVNLDPVKISTDILRASLVKLEAMAETDSPERFTALQFANWYRGELAQRVQTLSRGLVLGGSSYVVLPPMQVSFAKGFILQVWIRPVSLVDDASIFEIEDPQDPYKRIALVCMADGSVELTWHNQDRQRRALVLNVRRLHVNRWHHLTIGFGPALKAPTDACVLFQHADFGGASQNLSVGNYYNPAYLGVGNDTVSSLRVAPGYKVTLYEHDDFRGASREFTRDSSFIGDFNDKVSSVKVEAMAPASYLVNLDGNQCSSEFLTAADRARSQSAGVILPDLVEREIFQNVLPPEGERVRGYIGKGVVGGASNLNIGEVILWNHFVNWVEIERGSQRIRRGDEVGLVGYWRPLDFQRQVKDHSPFQRHGHFVGPRVEGAFPAPEVARHSSAIAARIGLGPGIAIDNLPALSGAGFTWQASVRSSSCVLFDFNAAMQFMDGRNRFEFSLRNLGHFQFAVINGDQYIQENGPAIPAGRWVHLAVVVDRRMISFFIDGERAGSYTWYGNDQTQETVSKLLTMKIYRALFGSSLQGEMAEVRLWDRALSDDLVRSTTGRRVHRWAPSLIACLRLDDDPTCGGQRLPWVIGLDRPADFMWDTTLATDTGLALNPAPTVASSAVFSSERGTAKLRGRVALPASASGFSVQFWLCARGATQTAVLQLRDHLERGEPTRFAITWAPNSNLTVTVRDIDGQDRVVAVKAGLKLNEWVHLSVTADREGNVSIYRDGVLVGRATIKAYKPAKTDTLVLGDGRRFTEFRFWDRALTQAEVSSNWRLKLPEASGLVQRFALDGNPFDFAGMPTESTALFREDPSIQWGQPQASRPTITAKSELVSEPVAPQNDARVTFLAMDLLARDDRNSPIPGADLTIVLSRPATLYKNSGHPDNRLSIPTNRTFTLKTDSLGRARLLIKVEDLTAPIFSIRHEKMGTGEWVLVTPDQVLHDVLASLTPEELSSGRPASGTRQATHGSLVSAEHSEKLARMLRTMLGCAAAATYELQSTEALAFGLEEGDPATPLVPLHADSGAGVHVELPEDAVLVRRIGRPLSMERAPAGDDLGPQSFGLFDDIGDFFSDVGNMVVNTVEKVVDSIEVAINTAIDGITVAFEAVVRTVEDMADAVWNVLKTIGKTIMEVLNFLCGLFDFGDYLSTADYLLDQLAHTLDGAQRSSKSMLTTSKDLVEDLEVTLLTALGDSGAGRTEPGQTDSLLPFDIDFGGPLGFILGQVTSLLGRIIGPLLESAFAPVIKVIGDSGAEIGHLLKKVGEAVRNSDFLKKIQDLSGLADGDPLEFFKSFVRDIVRLVTSLLGGILDIAAKVIDAVFSVLRSVLFTELDIPLLSWILGDLSVGRLLSLIIAIPLTLAYKLITRSSDGPFDAASVVSFGDTDLSAKAAQLALRSFDLGLGIVLAYVNIGQFYVKMDPAWMDNPAIKPFRWLRFALSFLKCVVRNNPHVNAALTGKSLGDMNELPVMLSYASWGFVCGSHTLDAIYIKKGSSASWADVGATVCDVGAFGCSVAAAACSKKEEWDLTKLDARLKLYDLAAVGTFGGGSFIAAVGGGRCGESLLAVIMSLYTAWQAFSGAAMYDIMASGVLE